jgi:outer membrane protein OmpA-like peptidoglycan-associated protein
MTHFFLFSLPLLLFAAQGCVATRDWVREQIDPVAGEVSDVKTRLSQTDTKVERVGAGMSDIEGRLSQMRNRLAGTEGRLPEIDAKADKALKGLSNLRLERRFVLNLKEGANFGFNSAALTDRTEREINSLLSDLKGDLEDVKGAIFVVAGHTDNMGRDEYNYELGRKRAERVARYLITQKRMDPLKVLAVSYGKSAPLADNATPEGRSKNRRVEILVYKEAISTSASTDTSPRAEMKVSEESAGQISAR